MKRKDISKSVFIVAFNSNVFFVHSLSVFLGLIMVNYRFEILDSLFEIVFVTFIPFMNIVCRDFLKFWNPFFYILTLLIVLFLLPPRVKYPHVILNISPIPYNPLPSTRIRHWIIIYQIFSKKLLAKTPVKKQVFS